MSKKVLGRGLESLIPSLGQNKHMGDAVLSIPLNKIKSNRFQPRTKFNEQKLKELAASIRKHGLAQPILVTESVVPGEYEIIAGERRYRASNLIGNKEIKAIVKKSSNDRQRFDLALIENIQRENLDPIEEAKAFQRLIEEFGHTHEEVAKDIGKERSVVSNTLRLLSLPEDVQSLIADGKISSGHGRILAGIDDSRQIKAIVDKVLTQHLSVRALEKMISNLKGSKKKMKEKRQGIELTQLKEEIQRKFGTKVTVVGSEKKGKIELYYYSLEDLERIVEKLNLSL